MANVEHDNKIPTSRTQPELADYVEKARNHLLLAYELVSEVVAVTEWDPKTRSHPKLLNAVSGEKGELNNIIKTVRDMFFSLRNIPGIINTLGEELAPDSAVASTKIIRSESMVSCASHEFNGVATGCGLLDENLATKIGRFFTAPRDGSYDLRLRDSMIELLKELEPFVKKTADIDDLTLPQIP